MALNLLRHPTPTIASALLALACASTPPLPEQRLCEPGQTSADWTAARLAEGGAEGLLDGLAVGAPTVFCRPDGAEVRGRLRHVGVERLIVEDGVVLRREPLAERGEMPRVDPRLEVCLVDLPASAVPVRVSYAVHRSR